MTEHKDIQSPDDYTDKDYDEFEMGDNKSFEFHLDGQLAHAVETVIGSVVRHLGYRIVWR